MITAASICALLLSIGLVSARRSEVGLCLCAAQGLAAATAFSDSGSVAAIAALVLNGVVVPLAAWRALGSGQVRPATPRIWLLASILLIVTIATLGQSSGGLATGVAVVLLGILIATHDVPALGLISAQNGVVLAAASAPDLSLPSALVAVVPLVPIVLLANTWLRR